MSAVLRVGAFCAAALLLTLGAERGSYAADLALRESGSTLLLPVFQRWIRRRRILGKTTRVHHPVRRTADQPVRHHRRGPKAVNIVSQWLRSRRIEQIVILPGLVQQLIRG